MAKQKRDAKKDALSGGGGGGGKKRSNKKTADSDATDNAANAIKLQQLESMTSPSSTIVNTNKLQQMKSIDDGGRKPTMNGAEKTKKKKNNNEKLKTQATEMNDVKIQVSSGFRK